jgi:group II intron reverse transcriptase/maturase
MAPSEPQYSTTTKLARIAWLSGRDPLKKFDVLMHLFNKESLTACFHELDGKKALGHDKVSKDEYGEKLNENLEVLLEKMKKMAYRPGPVREVLIPKEGKAGSFRPLGIGNFEDKLVQKMTAKILESIFEPTFLDCSYGFRPGLGCHDAIRGLNDYLYANKVETVIDVDLANFFGTIGSGLVNDALKQRINDERFLRYIQRLFKAGVLSQGELTISDEGVPQGSPASPILANIVAHYVIDHWFENTVKKHCKGKVAMFRYCDDLVICCQYRSDAPRVHKGLGNRLTKYGLKLNEEKTRQVSFSKEKQNRGIKQESFDFLGFTFFLGKSAKGFVVPKLKTSRKRLISKLKNVTSWMRINRSRQRLPDLWKTFCAKVRGHVAYYGVSNNQRGVSRFILAATHIFFKWLNKRGGRKLLDWDKFNLFMKRNPPPKAIIHHKLFMVQTSK